MLRSEVGKRHTALAAMAVFVAVTSTSAALARGPSGPVAPGSTQTREFNAEVHAVATYKADSRHTGPLGTNSARIRARTEYAAISDAFTVEARYGRHNRIVSASIKDSAPELTGSLVAYSESESRVQHTTQTDASGQQVPVTCTSGVSEQLVGTPSLATSLRAGLMPGRVELNVGHIRITPPIEVGWARQSQCGDVSDSQSGVLAPSYLVTALRDPDDATCTAGGSFNRGYESSCTYLLSRGHGDNTQETELTVDILVD